MSTFAKVHKGKIVLMLFHTQGNLENKIHYPKSPVMVLKCYNVSYKQVSKSNISKI